MIFITAVYFLSKAIKILLAGNYNIYMLAGTAALGFAVIFFSMFFITLIYKYYNV